MAQSVSGWRSGAACSCTLNRNRETCRLERRMQALFGGLKRPGWRLVCSATPSSAWQAQWCGSEVPSEQGAVRAGDAPAPRTAEQVEEAVCRVVVELAVPSGEAGSFGPGECDTTSAAAAAVAKLVVEARPPGIAKHSATTESVFAESPVQAGSSWSRAGGTEEPRVKGCGDGTEGSRVGVCGDGTEGSRVGACGDGTEGSRVGVCGEVPETSCEEREFLRLRSRVS